MPMVFIRHVGANLAYIHSLEGFVDPDYGVGSLPPHVSGGPIYPGGHPGHGLPGRPPHVSNRPPIYHPGHPDHGLPSEPGIPDNELPSARPPVVLPGWTLLLVRGADGKWKYATLAPASPPPRPLPEPIPPGGAPDQGLPPQPAAPDQGLPTPPPVAGTPPVTPAPTPQRR